MDGLSVEEVKNSFRSAKRLARQVKFSEVLVNVPVVDNEGNTQTTYIHTTWGGYDGSKEKFELTIGGPNINVEMVFHTAKELRDFIFLWADHIQTISKVSVGVPTNVTVKRETWHPKDSLKV